MYWINLAVGERVCERVVTSNWVNFMTELTDCRPVKTVRARCTLLLSIPVICCLQVGHETAESFSHNHNLDVTLWSCNTRNWKLNFRISAVAGQSQRLIPVLLQVNGPCDRTLWHFVCNDVLFTKENLPETELVCTYTQIMTGNLCRPAVLVRLKSELRSLGHFPG